MALMGTGREGGGAKVMLRTGSLDPSQFLLLNEGGPLDCVFISSQCFRNVYHHR